MFQNLRSALREWQGLGLRLGRRSSPFWTQARMAWAELPIDPERVREWLPFPLRLVQPATASVFIADYPQTSFGSVYHEAAILLDVTLFGWRLQYCPWMIVDDDSALILGREMLGYPKKMGTFRFEERDGHFFGSVERGGEEVFRLQGRITRQSLTHPPLGIGRWQINLRGLIGLLPAHLLLFRPQETVHAAQGMDEVEVALTGGVDDPIDIAAGAARCASLRTCDIGGGVLPPPLRLFPVGPFLMSRLTRLRLR